MSRNKKGINPVTPLTTSADFANAIEESEKRLVVIDIHQNWCGPCTTVEPIFRKAYLELEQPESRLKIYTVRLQTLLFALRRTC
jgi:thioredoxin-like negative regulator of GroEL